MGYRMLLIAFFPTDPRCYGNEIWDNIGYSSRRVKNFCKIFCVYWSVFGDGPLNAANCIFPHRPC